MKKAEKLMRREKRELESLILEKDAKIADLQLEIRAKEALLDANKNGIDLNQIDLYYDTNDSRQYLPPSSQMRLEHDLKNSYQSKVINDSDDGGENVKVDEEFEVQKDFKEEELKECHGELLHQPGNRREKSIIDLNEGQDDFNTNFNTECMLADLNDDHNSHDYHNASQV